MHNIQYNAGYRRVITSTCNPITVARPTMNLDIVLPQNSKAIPLTKSKFAIVDNEDFLKINESKWQLWSSKNSKANYAIRTIWDSANKKKINNKMHREIMGNIPIGMVIDHINGNGLDNRKENLRLCSSKNNSRNTISWRGYSKYKGVSWHKWNKAWVARIRVDYKLIHLGYFVREEEAAIIYNHAAIKYFGRFAKLNIL